MAQIVVTASLTAENTFTDSKVIGGNFNLSISNTFDGIVTIQRSFDGSNWNDVESYSGPVEKRGYEPQTDVTYRVGFKTGDFTSGQADIQLSR